MMRASVFVSLLLAIAVLTTTPATASSSLSSSSPDERAAALVAQMTLAEKLSLLHGPAHGSPQECLQRSPADAACAYTGNVAGVPRLGIPPINMEDGPQGFRDPHSPGTTTAFPSGLTVAAAFDPQLAKQWGIAMAREFKAKGANVLLGPALCVARVPNNGRNFEYMSGEDPCLGAKLTGPTVEGIQSVGIVATAKHWVFNNQVGSIITLSLLTSIFKLALPSTLYSLTLASGEQLLAFAPSHLLFMH
jgi:beta-glucosidase